MHTLKKILFSAAISSIATIFLQAAQAQNRAPTITSTPGLISVVDKPYSYTVTASDLDNDELTYSRPTGPAGSTINSSSGLFTYTPTTAALGLQPVTLRVSEQLDPNLGFYYLRARYMDPARGGFVSMDSWMGSDTSPTTLNKYLYADGGPTWGTDPSGMATLKELGLSINKLAGLAKSIIVTGVNAYNKVDEAIVMFEIGQLMHSAAKAMPSPGSLSFTDNDYSNALRNSDAAVAHLANNMGELLLGIRRHKQETIEGFTKSLINQKKGPGDFVLFGPTPSNEANRLLLPPDATIGKIKVKKASVDVVLSFWSPGDASGMMFGAGFRYKKGKKMTYQGLFDQNWHNTGGTTKHPVPPLRDPNLRYWGDADFHYHIRGN